MSVNKKLTAIADRIRTLVGLSNTMSLDAMSNQLDEANKEVGIQADLIEQILIALQGNAPGGDNNDTAVTIRDDGYGNIILAGAEFSDDGACNITLIGASLTDDGNGNVIIGGI